MNTFKTVTAAAALLAIAARHRQKATPLPIVASGRRRYGRIR
jgi:hypothetical protein